MDEYEASRYKNRIRVQVDRLHELLNTIKPKRGNFLLPDLTGRIIWNATAITNSISQLAYNNNDYGVQSLIRKQFECYLLLDLLLTSSDQSKLIAKIMAYEFFDFDGHRNTFTFQGHTKPTKEEAIDAVKKVVEGFKEDKKIVDYFISAISSKKKHWHWSEQSFDNIIKRKFNPADEFERESLKQRLSLYELYNKSAHVDVHQDRLIDLPNGKIKYSSPLEQSTNILIGLLGLSLMINEDIFDLVEEHRKNIG